jgi:hypothetical protein
LVLGTVKLLHHKEGEIVSGGQEGRWLGLKLESVIVPVKGMSSMDKFSSIIDRLCFSSSSY